MVHSKKVWKISGKRASLLVPISIFVAIATLIGLIALVFIKADKFEESLGDRQLELFRIYQIGEKYLRLVDGAAVIAVKPALLKVADTGLKKSSLCGSYVDKGKAYTIWISQSLDADSACEPKSIVCYPDAQETKEYFAASFRPEFEPIIKEFNANTKIVSVSQILSGFSANIPEEYEFYVGSGVKPTIVGIAKNPIVLEYFSVKKPSQLTIRYKVTPSFTEPIEINFLQDRANLVDVAEQLFGKPKKDAEDLISSVDNANGLDWDFAYDTGSKPSSPPCTHSVGPCSCCKTVATCEERDADGNCVKEGTSEEPVRDGTSRRTVPYDIFNVTMSVKVNDPESSTGHKQFFVYDEAAKKVVPKELEYMFALNWVEAHPDKATTFCSCGEGHPC